MSRCSDEYIYSAERYFIMHKKGFLKWSCEIMHSQSMTVLHSGILWGDFSRWNYLLILYVPVFPFNTPWKYQKNSGFNLWFSDIFKGYENGTVGYKELTMLSFKYVHHIVIKTIFEEKCTTGK